ncbi:pyridoxamine 5'-phosphate oxidase [Marinilongibacter aquaticus]|uniref:pyridoxamine 5'-phosphate oxidase n=1 Tax=Marinilongibacter aquaticus TaxID=2975157 RepID=UPI0021BD575F|nr:pyridoxamine 5'-phosphate oxidase [Marinilongibacter aquaticus]UBM58598.1 pyridoxamine 5'-phosphate oxidase [Marinilongibacter aquaticus]
MVEMVGNSKQDKELKDLRIHYSKGHLLEDEASPNPFLLFGEWFDAAQNCGIREPNAMVLSTIDHNRPKARVVLLKDFDENGFVFFTNYASQKGREIDQTPFASLTFFWDLLERQVRIEGKVAKISEEESTAYFHSRPRGSQIGAWASHQSEVISSREVIENRQETLSQAYGEDKVIPKPDFWGGYRVVPDCIEFWQGRASRLHDRLRYTLDAQSHWDRERLSP